MKLLLALLLLISTNSQAKELAYMPNKAGGEIIITTDKGACEAGLTAISRAQDGTVFLGCWMTNGSTVYVTVFWVDDTMSLYKMTDFRLFEAAAKPNGGDA